MARGRAQGEGGVISRFCLLVPAGSELEIICFESKGRRVTTGQRDGTFETL
jgi:hypothetical protein